MFGKRECSARGKMIAASNLLRAHARGVTRSRRCVGFAALSCMALSLIADSGALGKTQQYSSSREYRTLPDELHDTPVRPSRMGTGSLLTTQQPSFHLNVHENASTLRPESSGWHLEISKRYWGITLTNDQTGLVWRLKDAPGGTNGIEWAQALNEKAAPFHLAEIRSVQRDENRWRMQVAVSGLDTLATLEIEVLSPAIIPLAIRAPKGDVPSQFVRLNLRVGGPYFGLGERFDHVRLDGFETTLRPEDLLGKPGHNWTYIPVPFLFTPRGLGMYLDTAKVSSFDLTGASQGNISAKLDDTSVDAYLFVGTPKEILGEYTAPTGRTPLPPSWAFGVWVCSYHGPDSVVREARRLRDEKIPAGAIWTFDVMDQGDIVGWPLWWTGYYPRRREFTDALHAMGFKVLTYIHPYVRSVLDPYNLPSPAYETGRQNGLFVLDRQGQPAGPAFEPYRDGNIDFTRPANIDWWEQKIREILLRDNFDGWTEDYGEWVNDTDRFAAGVSGRTMANLNPLFYHKITYEIAHKAKPDVVEFVRSGYAASQGYTRVVWGGHQFPDWSQDHGLPSVVRAGVTVGMSGYSRWGPDIAENGHSKELWSRWVEFGALTPVMRDHPWDRPEGAINIWHDAETIETFREYTRLHLSLFPIFDAYAHEVATTGLPIMRHLLLEFPNDAKTYDCDDEYLIGDKILVAPVIEQGATTRSLYLPQGSWTDYWTGTILQGGREVTVAAPLQQIPILVRAGSLLPLLNPDTETLAQDLAAGKYWTLTGDLTWRIFRSTMPAHSSFVLGDGTVADPMEDPAQIEIKVQHSGNARHNEVIVPANGPPHEVLLAGEHLPQLDSGNKSQAGNWIPRVTHCASCFKAATSISKLTPEGSFLGAGR
jgi:alpha-glucosidase (family GH31 glycosyl hydrolase)